MRNLHNSPTISSQTFHDNFLYFGCCNGLACGITIKTKISKGDNMKHIITLAALVALTSTLSATTPSELIRQARHPMIDSDRSAQHHREVSPRKKTAHRVAPAHRVRSHAKPKAKPRAHSGAKVRHFMTLDQYRRGRQHKRKVARHARRHTASRRHATQTHGKLNSEKLGRYVGNGWFVDDRGQYDEQYREPNGDRYIWVPSHSRRQRSYRHYRRQWYLTYLYERAEFDDKHGYHYGYFDRFGFEFDGQFYYYDRAYTYQDRLHGKGLFEHRFYRPIRRRAHRRHTWREISGGNVRFEWQF